jgi:hypothetical protein
VRCSTRSIRGSSTAELEEMVVTQSTASWIEKCWVNAQARLGMHASLVDPSGSGTLHFDIYPSITTVFQSLSA